jgi:outer membrane lipoprotein-sorting protein
MPYLVVLMMLLVPQRLGVPELERGIQQTYGRLNDFSADFVQIQQDSSNRKHLFRGHLYLKSGRRMRFEYRSPEEKFFYSNGKTFTEYVPGTFQAIQTPLGKSADERLTVFMIPWNAEWRGRFKEIVSPPPGERALDPGRTLSAEAG